RRDEAHELSDIGPRTPTDALPLRLDLGCPGQGAHAPYQLAQTLPSPGRVHVRPEEESQLVPPHPVALPGQATKALVALVDLEGDSTGTQQHTRRSQQLDARCGNRPSMVLTRPQASGGATRSGHGALASLRRGGCLMTNSCRASLWLSACLVLVACGGPGADNAAPTVGAVEDQTVLRNTSNPRSVSVELSIADPDEEAFTVSVDSEDEQTLPDTTFGCGPGACTLVLTPSAAKTADVNVNVTVSDGSGGQATTGFVIHVVPLLVTTAADDGPGSLRQTILDSEPGDVIGFDVAGEFASPMNIALTTQITLDSDLTIEGAGRNPFNVVIEAAVQEGSVRLFEVAGGATVVLRDLQLRGGAVQDPGVGGTVLVNEGGGLSLVGCLLQDSFARLGGFVYNAGGEVVLDDTIVEGTLSHPTREHNAAEGGAIFNAGGTVSVRNGSRISYSRTTGDGGAVSQIGSTAVTAIDDSEVLENTAGTGFGGGIHLVEGVLSISGSVFVGNSVEDGIGGAIALRPPTVMAVAPGDPGTGSGPSDGPAPSLETETLTIEETTVRGNSAPDCGGIAILGDFSARIEDSVIGDPDLGDEE